MRNLYVVLLILLSNPSKAQLYNLIYMDNVDGSANYDYNSNAFAGQFMNSYASKNYNLAILFLDSLEQIGRWDHKIAYDKAICYHYLFQKDSCKLYVSKYLSFPNKKIKPGLVKKSFLMEVVKTDVKLDKLLNVHIKKAYKKISNPEFAMELEYLNAREQEILMDTNYTNGRKLQEKNELLTENFKPIKEFIINSGLPTEDQIGSAINIFGLMVLHMDYDPAAQLKISREMLLMVKQNNYNVSTILYAIDRALKNLGLAQEFGSIVSNRGTLNSVIYQYDGTIEDLNSRRAKYGLVPMEIEVKNYQINQLLK